MEQFDISDFCSTKAQAMDFVSRLERVTQQIYGTSFSLEKSLQEQFGIQKKDKFMAFLRDNEVNNESNSALGEFMDKIISKINSLPVVNLTMAFEPDQLTLRDISQWFVLNNKQVLLEIKVDTQMVAGAVVDYNGKHNDFSVREIFKKIFNESIKNAEDTKTEKPVLLSGHNSIEHFSLVRR
jgi:F0F1-type ATP synthase delta subunit